ncbi:hypothetical protein PQY66_06685 [Luminiphilus sp.]|jgi:CMP-N,N'-diacetyllegionaminic acid synthase|nr:hypothetical protein [Luminiphilus sp.]
MRDLGKVVAFIPARAGSKRVKAKNLRDLCGQPLLAYSIKAAKACFNHADIYVNSDSAAMLQLGLDLGVNTYERLESLASDEATGDQFTIDFIRNIDVDTLVMVSPVCPLITSEDITNALEAFRRSDCDTLISCDNTQMQTFCGGSPVNINLDGQLAPTQENPIVSVLNWAVTIWDARSFSLNYESRGSAYIGVSRVLHPIDPLNAVKISNETDFQLAEALISARNIRGQNDD